MNRWKAKVPVSSIASRKNDGKVRGFCKDRERQEAAAMHMVVPTCQVKGVIDGYITLRMGVLLYVFWIGRFCLLFVDLVQ